MIVSFPNNDFTKVLLIGQLINCYSITGTDLDLCQIKKISREWRERVFIQWTWLHSFDKHLMTSPKGNNEFCFTETLNEVEGKHNSLFSAGPVMKSFVLPPNSGPDHVRVESSCRCLPGALVSFNQLHVTRFPPIAKRIWVARRCNGV